MHVYVAFLRSVLSRKNGVCVDSNPKVVNQTSLGFRDLSATSKTITETKCKAKCVSKPAIKAGRKSISALVD